MRKQKHERLGGRGVVIYGKGTTQSVLTLSGSLVSINSRSVQHHILLGRE